jgi:prepilin-type N-terminal cleavage/methylation domain-containing protein
MSIKPRSKSRNGWSLVEMMVALAIFSIAGVAMMSLWLFGTRSLTSLANYAGLDLKNRQAMDLLTCEIRQALQITEYTTNATTSSITLVTGGVDTDLSHGHSVQYLFDKNSQTFVRNDLTTGEHKVLLNNCSLLAFDLRTRAPIGATFEQYPVATNNWQSTVKVLQLTWKTSTVLPSGVASSENVQTARIVVRKQQDS